jgi:hypothetical protein
MPPAVRPDPSTLGAAGAWEAHAARAACTSSQAESRLSPAARAGHASVSFTLDRYGHLYPEADLSLRERLDAMFAATQERDS